MNFELNDMQQMLVDSADKLVRDHADIEKWRARRALADGVDGEMWATFAELGWLALAVPEDAGGLGGSMEDVCLLMIELGRGLVLDPIVTSGVLAAHIVDRAGSGDPRAEVLGGIASGDLRVALAHAEVADPYDVTGARQTRARRDGDEWVIDGAKMLALDAPSAGRLLVTAGIADEPGFGIFLVDASAAGLAMEAYPLIDATRAADIVLDGVRVSRDRLLASGEAAVALVAEAVDRANLALMAQAIGSMEASLTICGEYAKDRKQFGQPIGKFQAIQHLASEMFAAAFEARSALYQALADLDRDAAIRSFSISIAKVKIVESGQIVGRNGIQIHGGYGMTDEYAISHHYRRQMAIEKRYGDIDYHLRQMAAARG